MQCRINLDMDGVLSAMVEAALDRLGVPRDFVWPTNTRHIHTAVGRPYGEVWGQLGDHQFWANIPPTQEAEALVSAAEELVGHEQVYILTKPTRSPYSASGKMAWLWQHLPYYVEGGRVTLTASKHLCARMGDVLVDDSPVNLAKWEVAGGVGVLVPRPWNYRWAEDPGVAVAEMKEAVRATGRCSSKKAKRQKQAR